MVIFGEFFIEEILDSEEQQCFSTSLRFFCDGYYTRSHRAALAFAKTQKMETTEYCNEIGR